MKLDSYLCPRCGYASERKDAMKRHFYNKVRNCPAAKNDIELTDEIKQYVLANRRYHVQKQIINTVHNTINNYHQINNFIASMDVMDKLNKYITHKNLEITDFEDKVDNRYKRNVKRLEDANFKGCFKLKLNDLLDIIDAVSTIFNGVEDFNIMYDSQINKLKIFSYGEWKTHLIDSGLKEIIETIQCCYLDSYECYLIKKLKCNSTDYHQRAVLREHLEEYYKFLACFNTMPFIYQKDDKQLQEIDIDTEIDNNRHTVSLYNIEDEFMPIYFKMKEDIVTTEANKMKREVKDIIKKNTKSNVIDLNKKMVELFQMDEQFKNELLKNLTL